MTSRHTGTPTNPAAGSPVPVRAAQATVPGGPSFSGPPLEGEGGNTSPAACSPPPRALTGPRAAGDSPSSPQLRRERAAAERPTSGAGADAPLLGSAPGQRRTSAPAGGALASTQADSVPPDRPNPIAAAMSEAQLDAHVRELCKGLGLLRYHTHDSRRSPSGFPDLVCVGPRGVLFRELKRQRGKVSAEQQEWLDALTAAGESAAVWRPASLLSGAIAAELAAISAWRVRRGQRCVCDTYGSCPEGCPMCPVCGGQAA